MRTAIYCRVSGARQKDNTSLPEQERIGREKAAALGWEVSEAHVYKEVEGGEDLYRPEMDRLWSAIEKREIDAVVIDVLDRLSRDEGDQGAFYHHCDRYGVTIELASQDIDETDHGRNLRTLAGIVARMERVDIRRRTQRGRKARVASGKMLVAPYPLYGYLWADPEKKKRTRYIPDPETWPVVVRIFTMVADGVPIRQVARALEAEGVLTPSQLLAARGMLPGGRPVSPIWYRRQITRIIHHPAYWGEHSAYRWSNSATKVRPAETGVTRKIRRISERAVDDPERVALPDACPALVSKDLAERAQARLAKNKEENPGRLSDPLETIWRGMAYCGHCGERMFTATGSQTVAGGRRVSVRRYYCRLRWQRRAGGGAVVPAECPGGVVSMAAPTLDPAGWADVRAWLENEENVSRLLAEWEQDERKAENSITSRVEATEANIRTLREKMNSLAETIAETGNRESRRTLQEKLDHYGDQVKKEERKREKLMGEAHDAIEHATEEREVREWVKIVASRAATASREEQRAALLALGARVTVWRADHVHNDGWSQRYKIELRWTGFTGAPVTLPASHDGNPSQTTSTLRWRLPSSA